ncbi:MAG: carbon starvation protein A [Selenomonadaceae bacterium]|nr:carbon starvation protein A [Selenomonadaceae bacterium]MBP3722605.1 carbon starvation protein A [Selenomonadaceae bacterium]
MITFIVGLAILIVGGAFYGRFCEKLLAPKNTATPALRFKNGIDFVPMGKWKNSLIELLNIAGTGPVLGPIQGILFGPIAFLTIPIGCVIGGAFHDYMSGMIALRNNGDQMPALVRRYLGKTVYNVYHIFICLLMLLVGGVFIYTPGDLFVAQILGGSVSELNGQILLIYAVIFAYYFLATLLPIDKIIGKIYPIFGAILLISAIGIFFGLFINSYPLVEIWDTGFFGAHPRGENFIPLFFVTVACGIVSGFHSTQATMISRTLSSEKHGRPVFYNSMIAEGFIAMTWAAAAMGTVGIGLTDFDMLHDKSVAVVGIIAKDMLGGIGGGIAVLGVIVLAITSGDTALRSLRMMLGDALSIDQTKKQKEALLAGCIFAVVAVVLFFAKTNPSGFSILWRYFSWANETIAVFAFAMITVYMIKNRLPYLMALIPGMFYMYIISSYILNAKIGAGLSWSISYIGAAICTIIFALALVKYGKR